MLAKNSIVGKRRRATKKYAQLHGCWDGDDSRRKPRCSSLLLMSSPTATQPFGIYHLSLQNERVASDKTHCKPFDLGNLSSGYLDRPMDANHTPSLEYTLLGRGLFFNSEVSSFQYGREKRA